MDFPSPRISSTTKCPKGILQKENFFLTIFHGASERRVHFIAKGVFFYAKGFADVDGIGGSGKEGTAQLKTIHHLIKIKIYLIERIKQNCVCLNSI